MEIRYIISMSGIDIDYPAFEKDKSGEWVFYEVDDIQALRMIDNNVAVPKDEKKLLEVRKNIDVLKAKKQAEIELAENIKNLDEMKAKEIELKAELKELSSKIKATETAVKG